VLKGLFVLCIHRSANDRNLDIQTTEQLRTNLNLGALKLVMAKRRRRAELGSSLSAAVVHSSSQLAVRHHQLSVSLPAAAHARLSASYRTVYILKLDSPSSLHRTAAQRSDHLGLAATATYCSLHIIRLRRPVTGLVGEARQEARILIKFYSGGFFDVGRWIAALKLIYP
jgi:hypothetical protein